MMLGKLFKILVLCIIPLSVYAENRTIATASVGGVYYPVGVSISSILTQNLKTENLTFSAISSAGSGENLDMFDKKEIEYALLHGVFGYMATEGVLKYENNKKENFLSICSLWDNVEHFVISNKYVKSANISDLKQLYGQKFSITEKNSGSKTSGELVLSALDIDYTKFDLQYLSFKSSSESMQNGKIVGMNTPGGEPVPAVSNLMLLNKNVTILNFTDEDLQKVTTKYNNLWKRHIISKDVYGTEKDIYTISQPNIFVVRKDMSTEEVYKVTKNLFEHINELKKTNMSLKDFNIESALDGLTVKLHPGAIKYYNEIGLKIPKHLL